MPRIKLTTLTPIHISSGEEYERNFNLLNQEGFIYLFDEFRITKFFIENNVQVPQSLEGFKNVVERFEKMLIQNKICRRKIESKFSKVNKTLLGHVCTNDRPIIPGSSIKGAIETAILNLIANDDPIVRPVLNKFKNKRIDANRFRSKNIIKDSDLKNLFRQIKVTDTYDPFATQVVKTINIKKEKAHQKNRKEKIEEIAIFAEAIKPLQSVDFNLDFDSISLLAKACNKYYIPKINEDISHYFYKKGSVHSKLFNKKLNEKLFLLNIGRFSGAEKKGIEVFSNVSKTAETFALSQPCGDEIYYENCLEPFGWVLCEVMKE